jgi:hypothetical protein
MTASSYLGFLYPWADRIVLFYKRGYSPQYIVGWLRPLVEEQYPERPHVFVDNVLYVLKRAGVYQQWAAGVPHPAKLAREQEIERLREDGLTLQEIGERLGITRSRVQQIFESAQLRRQIVANRAAKRARSDQIIDQRLERQRHNLGRPIDMGGPRDQWLEKGPWDEV